MSISDKIQFKIILGLAILLITLFSYIVHIKPNNIKILPNHYSIFSPRGHAETLLQGRGGIDDQISALMTRINRTMPNVNFTALNETTSAINSTATIVDYKPTYCIGDTITVQVQMYNYLGKKKTYGRDFLKARIFSSNLGAGVSGKIEDFNNGTYNVYFTLFWEGQVKISILLMHPSEGVSALWKSRNNGYNYIAYTGSFLNNSKEVYTECGLSLDTKGEKCEYGDKRYGDYFYCMKPSGVACQAFISLKSQNKPYTYFTSAQKSLFTRSNYAVEISKQIESVNVVECSRCITEMSSPCNHKIFLAIIVTVFLISFIWYRFIEIKLEFCKYSKSCTHFTATTLTPSKDDTQTLEIFNRMSAMIPKLTLTDLDKASSARRSRATVLHPKPSYCVGDKLIVQVEIFDNLDNKKTYGGDFMKTRIFSPNLKAAASGRVEDFNNGTYHVHFTLFWEGQVHISIVLYHPSEGVAALWRARNKDYGLVSFMGTFVNGDQQVKSECGFQLNSAKDICKYGNEEDHEAFYCYKPDSVSCWSLAFLQSFNKDLSFLTPLEKNLFKRENIAIEIPSNPNYVYVQKCNTSSPLTLEQCKIGMASPFPSGFQLQNTWNPVFCSITNFTSLEHKYKCLSDKMIYFIGDSTVRQWSTYLVQTFKGLQTFNLHRPGMETLMVAVDQQRNIHLQWKKHSHPIVASRFYLVKDDAYVQEQIDRLNGGAHCVIVICLGQHFRPFPLQLFIRRIMNVQKALNRLFLRSPDTKVIIKAENTREINTDAERFSDFHGYIQYLVVKDVFKNLPVAVVDAWDMTIAYGTHDVHPPEHVIKSQIDMFLTYIC
ncbi:NXPE family member 4-like [Dendropsophus ebraccatus]|uniref:NXPE family member 4-like n=1 Tax=Dendropsophus ebraccatus TaxID=150705 RepID=UPI00383170C2